ncbi:phage holin family protein [uncultured Duncaniella sp.]|uniref:phage holin family protein n=1 Tax=uncultured Duncaniella sp. TaxID=2768039 RepID=UPI0026297F49|nr:phage holin family protein [uncultured Duncaniella sp.]
MEILSQLGIEFNISIALIAWLIGNILKAVVLKDNNKRDLIPLSCGVIGGIIGIVFYYVDPTIFSTADNVISAMTCGIASAALATGANELVKRTKYYGSADEYDASKKGDSDYNA